MPVDKTCMCDSMMKRVENQLLATVSQSVTRRRVEKEPYGEIAETILDNDKVKRCVE
jgi:hypothetical protein